MARDSAGVVVNLSPRGLLVKSPRMVPIGTPVVDARHQNVGRVVDVLGPVKAPYLLLSPAKGARLPPPGREVYFP